MEDSIFAIHPYYNGERDMILADDTLISNAAGTPLPGDSEIIGGREPEPFRFADGDTVDFITGQPGMGASITRIFEEHALKPVNHSPVPVPKRTPDWFSIVLLFVVIAFTWIRVFYHKIFRQLIAAFFNNSIANQVVRDENILIQRASILMSFVFYLTASLFIYQVSTFFEWDYPFLGEGFLRFLVVSLIVAFSYSFKMVLLKGLGEVFDLDRPVAGYIFNIFLINNILGLALIPVVVTLAFVVTYETPVVIYTGIGLVIIAFIYRLVRAVSIWMALPGVSLFYLILYFCTLEIAPLVIIVKLAMG